MNKNLILLIFITNALFAKAQTPVAPLTQPYGKIDTADLKLTSCDFEKDANAMVLFDKARVVYKNDNILMERHKRIKIFNNNAKDEANIKIVFYGAHRNEEITEVEAETINLNGNTIEYTPVEKNLIYTEATDKEMKAIVFTFPNVKPGSVVEFKYKFKTPYPLNYPDWLFQNSIPTRYSELDGNFTSDNLLKIVKKTYQPLVKDSSIVLSAKERPQNRRHIWAMANVKTYKIEPYMDSPEDYLQCILFKPYQFSFGWGSIANELLNDIDFGGQLNKLDGDDNIKKLVEKSDQFKTEDEKLAYLFNAVKTTMKWNKVNRWYAIDGIKKAWNKKVGNSTEVNLVLYNVLKAAGMKPSLMILRTKDKGNLDTENVHLANFNKTIVFYPITSEKGYILDATNQYATYNEIPFSLIGVSGLMVDPGNKKYVFLTIKNQPARENFQVKGNIGADGKLSGSFEISSTSYSRERNLMLYDEIGEKKFIEGLQKEYNGLKVSSYKLENRDNEKEALLQKFEFTFDLIEPDGDYIYFNPNQFTGFHDNPFLSDTRVSNIDFGGLNNYSVNGSYKVPPGYKISALPKSVSLVMPDKSIVFKRVIGEYDGDVVVRYAIEYKRSAFGQGEYGLIYDFFKKMYEMLNEPVVLKKS